MFGSILSLWDTQHPGPGSQISVFFNVIHPIVHQELVWCYFEWFFVSLFLVFCLFYVFVFVWGIILDKFSSCSYGWLGTHYIDQNDLKLRDPSVSASQVLGLKVCATIFHCMDIPVVFYKKKPGICLVEAQYGVGERGGLCRPILRHPFPLRDQPYDSYSID